MRKAISRRCRIGAVICVLLLIGAFAALNVLAYRHAHSMMYYTDSDSGTAHPEALSVWGKIDALLLGIDVPRPVSDQPPTALAPDCQVLEIAGPGRVVLTAWYCDRGRNTPLVILFHGYTAEKTALLHEAQRFLDMGTSVLLADFRGSGGSSEAYTTVGISEAEDVVAIARYAQGSLAHHRSTVLFGQSMGAAAILRAVHVYGLTPDAVILEAVFDTMLNTVRNRFRLMNAPACPTAELLVFWGGQQERFNAFTHRPVDYASSLACPSLFMHGSEDPRATLEEGQRVFGAAGGEKQWHVFEGAGHTSYAMEAPASWEATVRAFLKQVRARDV